MPSEKEIARRIGRVEIFAEKFDAIRSLSSCCVGAEAYLETLSDHPPERSSYLSRQEGPGLLRPFRPLIRSG